MKIPFDCQRMWASEPRGVVSGWSEDIMRWMRQVADSSGSDGNHRRSHTAAAGIEVPLPVVPAEVRDKAGDGRPEDPLQRLRSRRATCRGLWRPPIRRLRNRCSTRSPSATRSQPRPGRPVSTPGGPNALAAEVARTDVRARPADFARKDIPRAEVSRRDVVPADDRGSTLGVSLRNPRTTKPRSFRRRSSKPSPTWTAQNADGAGIRPVLAIRDARARASASRTGSGRGRRNTEDDWNRGRQTKRQEKREEEKEIFELFRPQGNPETCRRRGCLGRRARLPGVGLPGITVPARRVPLRHRIYCLRARRCLLRQLVAEEGIIKVLMFRFFPPYQWWFVFTRWQDAKDFFAFFLAGAMVMSLGGADHQNFPRRSEGRSVPTRLEKMLKAKQAESPPPAPLRIADDRDD